MENHTVSSPEKWLHVIAFDVPYPANYGGIVDVFQKLKSFHAVGVKVIFHCFYYRGHNKPTPELNKYAHQVYYYRRKQNIWRVLFSVKPYIVSSRKSNDLLKNLLRDKHPIFFDGLQTCFYLDHPSLFDRKRYVRANNIEHDYYFELANVERNFFKRHYLLKEGERLHAYEPVLQKATALFPVAKMDMNHFEKYGKSIYVPPFFSTEHARNEVNKSDVQGRFILFQGNLRVRENELAAKFIINEIAPLVKHTIVIAGKSPSTWLKNEASIQENVRMIESPSTIQMDSLIQYAQVNLLVTFQQTGVKLKLLHALEKGKHILINDKMDDAGIFSALCAVKNEAPDIARKLDELMKTEFTEQMRQDRFEKFDQLFNNRRNILKIVDEIFS